MQQPSEPNPVAPLPGSLAAQLEDGPLRRELGIAPDRKPAERPPSPHDRRLRFTGTGSAYFRVWVVQLLLTLLTLGVYSAWAKVRKARWFAQHTELDGDRFDFHGQPWRILAGRVVALALLAAWTWAFDIATWLGLAVLGLFCVLGPLLFASAQRFKLANTSWRGLHFGFDVPRRQLYVVCVPMLLLWTAGTVAQALGAEGWGLVAAGLLPVLGLPWAHARLKQMQHSHAEFGGQRFRYDPSAPEFYGLYAKGVALAVVGAIIAGVLAAVWAGYQTAAAAEAAGDALNVERQQRQALLGLLAGVLAALLMWLMAWPWFAARLQQIVWGHTHFGRLRFRGEMRGGALWGLVLRHMLGVLLTCGLWWPFAAVAIARYRVQSLVVLSDEPLAEMHAPAPAPREGRAAGDGAADFFGLDIGW
ncbi:YjgN family protein [Rubrivivax rivuli]|nr:YjgN family protein [Rubrivivax rivuli]